MSVDSTNKKRRIITIAAVFLIIAAIVVGCYIYDTETLSISDFLYDTFDGLFNPVSQPKNVAHNEGELVIHFVDVGQGDCIIIQFPDNKNMIIDGGPRSAKNTVLNYIDNLEIKTFDYLLLTHSDEDHCGSLTPIITNYKIKTIYRPEVATSIITTAVYRNFVNAVEEEKKAGAEEYYSYAQVCNFGVEEFGYYMEFVTPNPENYNKVKSGNAEAINSISPIMMLSFFDKKIMFTGDANFMSEEVFFKNVQGKEEDYNVDVLKVGHHGSRTSTSMDFLNVVKPEIAVISVGKSNTYGHPAPELLARLKYCNDSGGAADVYRTDEKGDVIIKLTSDGISALISQRIFGKDESSSAIIILVQRTDLRTLLAGIFIDSQRFSQ